MSLMASPVKTHKKCIYKPNKVMHQTSAYVTDSINTKQHHFWLSKGSTSSTMLLLYSLTAKICKTALFLIAQQLESVILVIQTICPLQNGAICGQAITMHHQLCYQLLDVTCVSPVRSCMHDLFTLATTLPLLVYDSIQSIYNVSVDAT